MVFSLTHILYNFCAKISLLCTLICAKLISAQLSEYMSVSVCVTQINTEHFQHPKHFPHVTCQYQYFLPHSNKISNLTTD